MANFFDATSITHQYLHKQRYQRDLIKVIKITNYNHNY